MLTLTATFSVDGSVTDQAADKHNQGTNHWWVDGVGTLTSATATVGDHLVLSDYTCFQKR